MNNEEKLLDKGTVLKRYHFKKWGLEWLIRTRKIPIVKIGRKIYFDPEDLESWKNANKISMVDNGGNDESAKRKAR